MPKRHVPADACKLVMFSILMMYGLIKFDPNRCNSLPYIEKYKRYFCTLHVIADSRNLLNKSNIFTRLKDTAEFLIILSIHLQDNSCIIHPIT